MSCSVELSMKKCFNLEACIPVFRMKRVRANKTPRKFPFHKTVEYSWDSTLNNKSKCKLTPKEVTAKLSIPFGVIIHLLSFYNLRPTFL